MDPKIEAGIRAEHADKIKQITELMQKLKVTTDVRERLDMTTGFIERIVVFLVVDDVPNKEAGTTAPAGETAGAASH